MKLAIMQPYFVPYIGYFQLIAAADMFIVYDNIKYTKKGWINRNRILQNGKEHLISLPLQGAPDYLHVRDRELSVNFNRMKLLNQLECAYRKAPFFSQVFQLVEQIIQYKENNLFLFLYDSLLRICKYLGITTPIIVSSSVDINHDLKSQNKVLALCKSFDAYTYINSIGGMELYSKEVFSENELDLKFIKTNLFLYPQFGDVFAPWLSIIDVMMFNSVDTIQTSILTNYELI